ncbi:hypothetical protein [Magnetofaba australis]|uniref:Putative Collagen n=1 Tax=Magnetofaba australis IT-1 TaxID=1434232 RepID=A0A1Y2KAA7_9PROT|nr:hypothetical protein [Magnetofaba australis]OSM06854.1 putative Collagen [Magnetofaba australis IT-1]
MNPSPYGQQSAPSQPEATGTAGIRQSVSCMFADSARRYGWLDDEEGAPPAQPVQPIQQQIASAGAVPAQAQPGQPRSLNQTVHDAMTQTALRMGVHPSQGDEYDLTPRGGDAMAMADETPRMGFEQDAGRSSYSGAGEDEGIPVIPTDHGLSASGPQDETPRGFFEPPPWDGVDNDAMDGAYAAQHGAPFYEQLQSEQVMPQKAPPDYTDSDTQDGAYAAQHGQSFSAPSQPGWISQQTPVVRTTPLRVTTPVENISPEARFMGVPVDEGQPVGPGETAHPPSLSPPQTPPAPQRSPYAKEAPANMGRDMEQDHGLGRTRFGTPRSQAGSATASGATDLLRQEGNGGRKKEGRGGKKEKCSKYFDWQCPHTGEK